MMLARVLGTYWIQPAARELCDQAVARRTVHAKPWH